MDLFNKVLFLILCSLVISCNKEVEISQTKDWNGWRGPDNNGTIIDPSFNVDFLENKDLEVWSLDIGMGYSPPSFYKEMLYVIGNNDDIDTVYCLNSKTGKQNWKFEYTCEVGSYPGPRSAPYIDNGLVYTISRDGYVYCLNGQSGTVVWEKNVLEESVSKMIGYGFSSSPIVYEDTLLINAGKSGLALDKSTGELLWSDQGDTTGYSTPVVFDYYTGQKSIAIMNQQKLQIVDIVSGDVLNSYTWEQELYVNAADPLVFDNKIFISSGYGKGCALIDIRAKDFKTIWSNNNLSSHFSSMIYKDGFIYGIDGQTYDKRSSSVRCIDAATGKLMWENKIRVGSLIMVNDKLIILDERGRMYIVEASNNAYTEYFSAKVTSGICWTAPVYNKGFVYVRSQNKLLKCLKASI